MKLLWFSLAFFLLQAFIDVSNADCTSAPAAGYRAGVGYDLEYAVPYYAWYYDPGAQECFQFWYLGKGGNNNNYDYYATCISWCYYAGKK
jgi:hypothetical protein